MGATRDKRLVKIYLQKDNSGRFRNGENLERMKSLPKAETV